MTRRDALRILHTVARVTDPHAVIAGGYVRDRLLGCEPKDIDIYLHVAHGDAERVRQQVGAALENAGFVCTTSACFDASEYHGDLGERMNGLVKMLVADSPLAPGTEVDLLMFREPIEPAGFNVLRSFDVALCKAALLPDGTEVYAGDFLDDYRNGTITVIRASEHAERMIAKFPGRRVVRL